MKEILGNEALKEHFRMAVRRKKISHAYILEGERGSGKKMMAEAFARMLQCEDLKDTEDGPAACGTCPACLMMKNRNHPDVIRVIHEKPNLISVGDIKEQLVNTVDVIPYKGPYKIYIVDEAEKMNPVAQNAVLKTIEEPPEYAVIFLLTSSRGAFLSTILSRCILLNMKPVPDAVVKRYLTDRCKIPADTADFCAGYAMGNIGKAREAAFSEEFTGLRELGLALLARLYEFHDYEIVEKVKELKEYKDRIADYLDLMRIWFRDVLVIKMLHKEEHLILQGEYLPIKKQSGMLVPEDINEIMGLIDQAGRRIRSNVNYDTAMETLHIEIKNKYK